MTRAICLMTVLLLVAGSAYGAQPKPKPKPRKPSGPEVVDPAVAKADPDFSVQGEYLVESAIPGGAHGRIGAQVIARGEGKFEIFILAGGLPGDGWKRGDERTRATGRREGKVTIIEGDGLSGEITAGKLTLTRGNAEKRTELSRIERQSPMLGKKPPEGAVVLFDGSGTDNFIEAKMSEDGNLIAGTLTKREFNSFSLHLELRLSWKPWATGQARSNSGVYVHDCYEIQVLDSFGLQGRDNECCGIYKINQPDVNMCLPPLVWQTYDIDFTAPKYNPDSGEKVRSARATVRHNGVVIHDDLELPHSTPGRQKEGPGPRPIHFQGHGNNVQYRNIWLKEKI